MPVAGWYQDPHNADQQRYWDGAAWTEHTAPSIPAVPPPGQPLGAAIAGPGSVPQDEAGKPNWFLRHKIISAVLALFVIVGIGNAMGGGGSNDDKTQVASGDTTDTSSPTADKSNGATTAPQDPASAEPVEASAKPAPKAKKSLQDKFVDAVEVGVIAATDADNEIQVVQARKKRATAMCDLLPASREIKGWTGTVDDVSTELGGDDGILTLALNDDIKVSTWNNSASDFDAHTLIPVDSRMYSALGALAEGDSVKFNGKFIKASDCLEEQSLFDENGMLTPTFSFKFTSVTKR
jgi:hypothetical protein